MPVNVHSVPKAGSPVLSSGGAVPRAAGVTMASKLANSSSKPSISRGTLFSARWYAKRA